MFPSSGFFSNIPCPYFVSGDCKRSNCHFRHQLPSNVSRSVTLSLDHSKASYVPTPKQNSPAAYVPTPITKLNKRRQSNEEERSLQPAGDDPHIHKPSSDETTPSKQEEQLSSQPASDSKLRESSELAELFGDDSDAEQISPPLSSSQPSQEIIVLPTPPKESGPVIDLTIDSSEDESTPNHSISDNSKPQRSESRKAECATKSSHKTKSDSSKHSHKSHKHKSSKHHKEKIEKKSSSSSSGTSKALPNNETNDTSSKPDATHDSQPDDSNDKSFYHSSSQNESDQCMELFANFKRKETQVASFSGAVHEVKIPETETFGKKRVARDVPQGAPGLKRPLLKKRSNIPSPQEMMQRRFEAMKAAAASSDSPNSLTTNSTKVTNGKKDYNVTPGVTSARTYKGAERKAHVPQSQKVKATLSRPRIPPNAKGKIPTNVRQAKLDMLIDECLKLYPDDHDAFDRAKNEELTANSRSSSRIIYANLIANVVKKLRDEQASKGNIGAVYDLTKVSHDAILQGKAANSITVGLKRKCSTHLTKEDMIGDLLFKKLRAYLMTPEQLTEHGFPRQDPDTPGKAVIKWTSYDKTPQLKDNMRQCRRCGKDFRLDDDGKYVREEDCVYHWGKAFNKRVAGAVEKLFTCCEGKPGSEGCTVSSAHVHETNKYLDLTGYMKTFVKSSKDYCGVYALDCEMVYTTFGLEVARVTVIDDKLDVMFDSFIKPAHRVLDYNTRFSGLTEENFKHVDTTLKDVQAILLDMFQEDTVLIGHSLNSDLVALKLIHETVVDTSLVFPHKLGLPYKRALRNLMLECLSKLIQEAGSAGHDSSEDAKACMELMKWKVFQDFQKDNRFVYGSDSSSEQ